MIELAPVEYHYRCDYDNIAFSLGVLSVDGKFGWRLPSKAELCVVTTTEYRGKCNWEFWLDQHLGYTDNTFNEQFNWVIPVRDLQDD